MAQLRLIKKQRGQTLVEMLVVIGLSAIMLPALATAMIASREGRAQEAERMQAAALLKEADEAVRSVREKGWVNIATNGTYRPSISVSSWSLVGGTETVGNFTRSIVISDVRRDAAGVIVASGGTVDSSTKKITTTVSWTMPINSTLSNESYYSRTLNNNAWTHTSQADFSGTKVNTTATAAGQVELSTGGGGGGIAFVQSAGSSNTAGAANIIQAFSGRVTGGNAIIVAVSWDTSSGTTTATCTDNQGNTYATATNVTDATNTQALSVCYATNVAGGTTSVTATFNGAPTFRHIVVSEYSGIALSSPVDVTRTNIANGTTATDNITSLAATTTTANDLIFGVVMDSTAINTSITAGTNFTQRAITSTQLMTEDRILATPGSVAATATFGTAHRYLAHMVAFKPMGTPAAWAPPNIMTSADAAGTEDALDVVVDGNYAYVADSTILRIYDITTTNPTEEGSFTAGGVINAVAVSGNYVYLATASNTAELTTVNASVKNFPTQSAVADLTGTNDGTAIFVANNHVYVGRAVSTTSGQNEFYIYNLATPGTPAARGSLNLTAQVNSIYVPTAVHAYIATSITTSEVVVVRIDTPTAPTSVGLYDASGTSIGTDIFATSTTVYLAKANNTSGAELFILTANTSNPNSVTLTLNGTGYEMGGNINGVFVVGTSAFLATAVTNNQFRVLNVTTPASPTVIGSLSLAAVGNDLFATASFAYVVSAHDTRELMVIRPTPTVSGGSGYQASGTYESPTFDAGASNNYAYNYIAFTLTEPTDTNITFQIATNNDGSTWNFVGPDGTAGTAYTAPIAIRLNTTGRYFRYKATLTSNPGQSATPALNDISINYSP